MDFTIWLVFSTLLVVVAVVARERFYDRHGRVHGGFEPFYKRMWAPPGSPASERPLASTRRRDPDPGVERARLMYWAAIALVLAFGAWSYLTGNPLR